MTKAKKTALDYADEFIQEWADHTHWNPENMPTPTLQDEEVWNTKFKEFQTNVYLFTILDRLPYESGAK